MRTQTFASAVLFLALASGCATVKSTRLREDWVAVDRQRVKRLLVVTAPLPEGGQKVGELFSLIARRDINLKRNFLVKETAAADALGDPKSRCAEGLEGVLQLEPMLKRDGGEVDATLESRLFRCVDGEEVWGARAKGSWEVGHPHVKELTAQYVAELGPEVEPYVPAAFYVLRATIEAMPDPVLNDDDIQEKIELGD